MARKSRGGERLLSWLFVVSRASVFREQDNRHAWLREREREGMAGESGGCGSSDWSVSPLRSVRCRGVQSEVI